jgi:hypothetical protein
MEEDIYKRKLPHKWVLYRYDKTAFRKLVNGASDAKNFPYTKYATVENVGQLIYMVKLLGYQIDARTGLRNIDTQRFVFMREDVLPLWEDEKNKSGGTYSIQVDHKVGFEIWKRYIYYLVGGTINESITGITVSCISSNTVGSNKLTYFKIWNGNPKYDKHNCNQVIPVDVIKLISNTEDIRYSPNSTKQDFTSDPSIISNVQIKNSPARRYNGNGPRDNYRDRGYNKSGSYRGDTRSSWKEDGSYKKRTDDDGFQPVRGRKR